MLLIQEPGLESGELVGKPPSFRWVVDARKGIVMLDEAEPPPSHLSCQQRVAVDVHPHRERESGLHADVHECEVPVKVVEGD